MRARSLAVPIAGSAAYGIEPGGSSEPPERSMSPAASLYASRASHEVAGRALLADQRWVGGAVYSRDGAFWVTLRPSMKMITARYTSTSLVSSPGGKQRSAFSPRKFCTSAPMESYSG